MRQSRSALRRAISILTTVPLIGALVAAGIAPVIAASIGARPAAAPVPALPAYLPNVTQFDVDGFLQVATLGGPGTGAHQGGTLTVNGQVVTVPAETIVILPANALTWQELFAQAPAPYTGVATGMAMADVPAPIATYEVHVAGNRVGDQYIAGMIDISQQGLNGGAGFVNFIDYATGEFEVGGQIGVAGTGTKVQLNDPLGRFGRVVSPDPRFTVDADNPTIAAGTGFPMCIPRTDPAGPAPDVLCPESNRIPDPAGGFVISQTMTDPALLPLGGALDPRVQAPMELGDYVNFSGTLVNTSATPTALVAGAQTYISAHTVGNNMAIYTAAGTNPAYVSIEVGLIGTGGVTVVGAGEAAIRTKFEGMTTDATRGIHLYGMDLNPADGSITERDWGTIGVDPGPAGGAGAVQGRWRFRPPCLAFGSVPTKPQTQCVYGPEGGFLPPTREVRAVIEGLQTQVPSPTALTAANGIYYGQYHAPIGEYIFPENIPGSPIVANNFESIPFLACGGYTSATGVVARQLNPWPGGIVPVCANALTVPTANAGVDQTAAAGATVTLTASGTGNPAPTFAWAQTGGTAVVLADTGTGVATFTAPSLLAADTLTFTVTATNSEGAATDTMTVTVNPVSKPTVNPITPVSVASGANGSFTISGTDPNLPPETPLTFTVTQTGAPALVGLATAQNVACSPLVAGKTCATVTFSAPVLPIGQVQPTVIQVTVTATNTVGAVSVAASTTVTINPIVDAVSITNAEYRTGKQRLILTATSSIISPNVTLKLLPYVTTTGSTFNPATLGDAFTNGGGGLYTITLVGAPQPAAGPSLQAKSSLGGLSPLHALDRVRA